MENHEKEKFHSNMIWFNKFFGGIKQLFDSVYDHLPNDFFQSDFELKAGNYYFPRQNYSPLIPSYYVLMIPGREWALQIYLIIDEDLISTETNFSREPSLFVVLHSQIDRYGYLEDYGLRIIGNRRGIINATKLEDSIVKGSLDIKFPADFFIFQLLLDEFKEGTEPNVVIRERIVNPIVILTSE